MSSLRLTAPLNAYIPISVSSESTVSLSRFSHPVNTIIAPLISRYSGSTKSVPANIISVEAYSAFSVRFISVSSGQFPHTPAPITAPSGTVKLVMAVVFRAPSPNTVILSRFI